MITFARLVVVSQHAFARDYQRQPVLEPMGRAPRRSWNAPHYDLREGVFGEHVALTVQQLGPHVGNYTNSNGVVNYSNNGETAENDG